MTANDHRHDLDTQAHHIMRAWLHCPDVRSLGFDPLYELADQYVQTLAQESEPCLSLPVWVQCCAESGTLTA